ncbi:aminoglycoside phosphotransferase family protein [Actinospica durhamensis]|uniref:Aminoglycoside phosphotransferase family protein n=1 Tax=Actinospica durhamensis TaxID=1508375 RepID=A0A941F0E5_9ACTN|nr:aminoglycoside phosphotransferase family protein [Actinospica durhamensis]MBR7837964.1 aminoglycoside phosphotransferase family protein [Actinospica durhamensis]
MSEDRLPRLHEDEADIHAGLVAKLLAAQFPQWADRHPRVLRASGTDHVTFRLGEDLVARMPRNAYNAGQSEADVQWMPRLAPHLPLTVPEPLAIGAPDHGYPFTWGVYRWLEGEPVPAELNTDPHAAAEMARFIRALRSIDPSGAARPTEAEFSRGGPLAKRDTIVREAIDLLRSDIDAARATEVWEACLAAPDWDGPPTLIHSDLMRGNVLAHKGHLSAVIDWGGLRAGDPAGDLLPAWHLFDAKARQVFRAEADLDAAAWARGLGWALSIELVAIPYYRDSAPDRTRRSFGLVETMLADWQR